MSLMCHGDVTPYLLRYVNGTRTGEEPDFDTQHKCRNFGKLLDWASKHTIKQSDFDAAMALDSLKGGK